MAVSVESIAPGSTASSIGGSTSLNYTHTTTSGSNQCLFIWAVCGFNAADTNHGKLSVTCDGTAAKSIGKVKSDNQEWGFTEWFYVKSPSAGSHSIVATGPSNTNVLIGASINLNGVDQTTPFCPISQSNFGNGASSSVAALLSKSTGLVLAGISNGSAVSAPGSGGTKISGANVNTAGGAGNGMCAYWAGASSVTPGFTETSDWWGIVAFHVNAAGDVVTYPVQIVTPPIGAQSSFASNFASSGSAYSMPVVNVPAGAVLEIVSGSEASSAVTSIAVSDVDSHTWTRLTPTFSGTTNPFAVDYWCNTTGAAVDVLVHVTPTYSNNKTLCISPRLIVSSDGTPVVAASKTGASGTPQASAIPSVLGSLMEFDYVQPGATAIASSLVSGSTGTSGTDYVSGGSGADAVGFGSIRQSAVNAQTSTSQAVGAGAPTNATYGVLLEHKPVSSSPSVPVGWANEGWS